MIMAKLDPKFTEALMAWYKGDHSSDESIRKGAELLLQLNRNRVLYQQILRTPQRMLKKLEYEIKKHIDIRLDGYSLDDVKKMAAVVMPHISAAAGVELKDDNLPFIEGQEYAIYPQAMSIGKRPDHDNLPDEIKKLWEINAERWKKIKATYELCKTLNAPCDLYEHLKVLKEAWYAYKRDMARYDDFRGTLDEQVTVTKGEAHPENEQQMVDYAQSYISRYLPQLKELAQEAKDPDFTDDQKAKLEDLRVKIQDRVNILLKAGVVLSEQRKEDLASVDIAIVNPVENNSNAEGEKSE